MDNTIYVIGHKNPDADAVCSSFAYAKLKSMIDKNHRYIAARCGRLNKQTKFIFEKINMEPPVFVSDIYQRVKDVMTKDVIHIEENRPLFYAIRDVSKKNVRLTPVIDENGTLTGIVSVFEISDFFSGKDVESKPSYTFRTDNCVEILKGTLYKEGKENEFEAQIIIGAMPFQRFKEYLNSYNPKKVVVVVGKRSKILKYSAQKGVSAIVLSGFKDDLDIEDCDLSIYDGNIIISGFDSAETARRLVLSTPVKSVMRQNPQTIHEDNRIEEAKNKLSSSDVRGLPVINKDKKLVGIITRSDIIKNHTKKVILMDHNEPAQAVDGIETAQILEIVDHHRLGTIKTKTPIHFCAKPVGSSSTLVFELYKENNIEPDRNVAVALLSGILSDTIILKSPTTTDEDIKAASELAKIADVNLIEYGQEMFGNTDSLKARRPNDIVESDFKTYEEYGAKIGIGQAEVVNLNELNECKDDLISELEKVKNGRALDWVMLLVTDIVKEESMLLATSHVCEKDLPYQKTEEKVYYLPGVLSRKKQLLPVILGILESCNNKL